MTKEPVKKKNLVKAVKYFAAASFAIAALLYLFFGPTAVRQGINLRKAHEHNKKLEKLFSNYPEFKKVRTGECTGNGGCIMLIGDVENEDDVALLKRIVSDSNPPVTVKYLILVKDIVKKSAINH